MGGGIASDNFNLTVASSTGNSSPITSNVVTGGLGGNGGLGGGPGGDAGNGGKALGGGVFFNNTSAGSLAFSFTGSPSAANTLTGGFGGKGGDSGPGGGANKVPGGVGGVGGDALGGGLYVAAGATSVNDTVVTGATLDGNKLTAGNGGGGGQGGKGTATPPALPASAARAATPATPRAAASTTPASTRPRPAP